MTLALILPACRKEPEPLDRNRAPETHLTVAPPETTEADYRVHMYWHGTDHDGIVTRYMWYRSDTLMTLDPIAEPDQEQLDWNPEARIDDYLRGTFTSRTDTVFVFTGYDIDTGALLNRQAFHIVGIDDGGKMDPSPARIQFFGRVRCLPEVEFWTVFDGIEQPYLPGNPDTISMFKPFEVKFRGSTCNGIVTGYQWVYEGKVYPDENGDGVAEWYIPSSPDEIVKVELMNGYQGEERLSDGDFYFKVIARDEAGALSRSDIITGEGVCQVIINHDPDTEILRGECFFYSRANPGVEQKVTIDFTDSEPDTMPYNSRLTMHYRGWDDPRDILEDNNPPTPIRFQYQYKRWSGLANFTSLWFPERAEDTNRFADEDSVTMRVGTFNYWFRVRSFDEHYRADGTPDTVYFYSNYAPEIDSLVIGYDAIPGGDVEFVQVPEDTIYLGIDGPLSPREGIVTAHDIQLIFDDNEPPSLIGYYFYYHYYIRAWGHDDWRDPPGSGIKAWKYTLAAEQDVYYPRENEWINEFPRDYMNLEVLFRLRIPFDSANPDTMYSIIEDPPLWMGDQNLEVFGKDLNKNDDYYGGIRATSPKIIPPDSIVPGIWYVDHTSVASAALQDFVTDRFYIKLVR
jgi:hypothetical protein